MVSLKLFTFGMIVAGIMAQEHDPSNQEIEILTERTDVRPDGYNFDFKTSDGVSRQEEGHLITVGEHQGIGVSGFYSYVLPGGQQYVVTFTADDKGYKPVIRELPDDNQ